MRKGKHTMNTNKNTTTQTGNPVKVAAADVDVRATIWCEVTKK